MVTGEENPGTLGRTAAWAVTPPARLASRPPSRDVSRSARLCARPWGRDVAGHDVGVARGEVQPDALDVDSSLTINVWALNRAVVGW
jgi:hypothetical protein